MTAPLLTPEEIAALREAFPASQPGERDVRPLRFPTVDPLPNEWWSQIRPVYEAFGAQLASLLGARLRSTVRVNGTNLSTAAAGSWAAAAAAPCCAALRRGDLPADNVCLEMAPLFALGLVDRMLGGPLSPCPQPRTPTTLDRLLLGDLQKQILAAHEQSWPANTGEVHLESLDEIPANWAGDARTLVLTCELALRCGELEGSLRLAMPLARLERVCGPLPGASTVAVDPSPAEMEHRLGSVPLECRIVVGEARLKLAELVELRVGDVICLDRQPGDGGELRCGDVTLFRVAMGVTGAKLGARILP